jgi:ribonuclease HI
MDNGKRNAKSGYGVFFGTQELGYIGKAVPAHEKQTNNVAELMAIQAAVQKLPGAQGGQRAQYRQIHIYSDSNYSIDVITGKKNAHVNKELIQTIQQAIRNSPVEIRLIHVYAHTDGKDMHSIGNDIADYLAGLKGI